MEKTFEINWNDLSEAKQTELIAFGYNPDKFPASNGSITIEAEEDLVIYNQEYVDETYGSCPVCGEYCIEEVEFEKSGNEHYSHKVCNSCKSTWVDTFILDGISRLKDKNGKPIDIEY